eukprot:COSAG02_NODE_1163_length_14166_cov_62.952797_1_plen_88_part_00
MAEDAQAVARVNRIIGVRIVVVAAVGGGGGGGVVCAVPLSKALDSTHRLIEIISVIIVILIMAPPLGGAIKLCEPRYIGILTKSDRW